MKFKQQPVTLKDGTIVIIRQAQKKDAASLLEAGIKYLTETPYLISELNEFNFTIPQEENWISIHEKSNNSLLLIAIKDKKLIGTLNLTGENRQKIRHNATLGIALLKKWHGLGLGKALLQIAIDWAKDNKHLRNLHLNVHATNSIAIRLYEECGFEKIGFQKNYIRENNGNFTDNIIMQLQL